MAGWVGYSTAGEILDFFYRGQAITIGGSLYLRLLVAPSTRNGGGTETNYTGYARLELPRDTSIFAAALNGAMSNAVALTLPVAGSVGNGQLVAFDIVDTSSGAFTKVYNGGPINPPKTVVVGKNPIFRIGALQFSF